ncbi:MAG: phosphotransferase [Micavibrio aeruginosavorus]|uniref:Phosphotransferase n=1 Tax=Micavibrio aeruginosavorus TaxID=349221 RepID=A0A2W5N9F0_9BACT|nr:MAG: phosphotransferase [Micavibrio aeruginosavorus]
MRQIILQSVVPKEYFQEHEAQRDAFLRAHVGSDYKIKPQGEDWASRRYFRVIGTDGKSRILMETVPDHIPTATMGHKLSSFIQVDGLLRDHGIHAPEILASNEREGFVLLEDFGDLSLHAAIEQGGDQMLLYGTATDILISMRKNIPDCNTLNLPKYKDSFIRKGRQRVVDWYIPVTRREKNSDDLLGGYLAAWDDVAHTLPPPPIGFIHGDYHAQNLMVLPDGTCGLLDFQDAMWGPLPYDLANILESIRLDVPADVHETMMKRYGADDVFRAWFRVMATQFHCRIIGQVLRLAIVSGKTDLLRFMPRIQNYIVQGLKDPVLKPLADWFKAEKVDLSANDGFDPAIAKSFIRSDAF